MTTDLKAAHYVLFNSYDFPKPNVLRNIFRELFGSGTCLLYKLGDTINLVTLLLFYIGILTAEGHEHKLQVSFCFKICSRSRCLILQVAQDFG